MLKGTIKLNMNEMPYLPPREVIAAAEKGLLELNRYANPEDLELLRELLADYSGVPKENIILGPGSDLLLREIVQTFSRNRKVVMMSPSFLPQYWQAYWSRLNTSSRVNLLFGRGRLIMQARRITEGTAKV